MRSEWSDRDEGHPNVTAVDELHRRTRSTAADAAGHISPGGVLSTIAVREVGYTVVLGTVCSF